MSRPGRPVIDMRSHRPPAELAALVDRVVGYRMEGFEPGIHWGMPGRSLTLIVAFEEPVSVVMSPDSVSEAETRWVMIAGLHDRAAHIVHSGFQAGIQIDLSPAGCRALLGMPASELARIAVDLADVLSRGRVAELTERLGECSGWEDRFDVLDRFLRAALRVHDGAVPSDPVADEAWRTIGRAPQTPIDALARRMGWSRRALGQHFSNEYGLSPKQMASVERFSRSHHLLKGAEPVLLAAVAAECGYADQAHMAREWRRICGLSPTAWRRAESLPIVQADAAAPREH